MYVYNCINIYNLHVYDYFISIYTYAVYESFVSFLFSFLFANTIKNEIRYERDFFNVVRHPYIYFILYSVHSYV